MRDVSTRNLRAHLDYARTHGISVEGLLAGLPITSAQILDDRVWLDWDVFAEIIDRLEAAVGPERMVDVGRFTARTEAGGPLQRVAGIAVDSRQLYRIGAQWVLPFLVRRTRIELQEVGRLRLRITLTLPDQFRPCAAWMRVVQGSLEVLPSFAGLPNARVHADVAPRAATYQVRLPVERRHLRATLGRRLRRLFGDAEMRELERQLAEIQAIDRERSELEDTLRERERLLSNLLRDLSAVVYRCDADNYHAEYVSGDSLPLMGRSPEQITADPKGFDAVVHPEDVESLRAARRRSLRAHIPCTQEYRILRPDGSVRWVLDVARGVYHARGTPIALEGFITDVTERKYLEGEVQRALRTESIGRLAGGVAHDFNNMLTAIAGFVELGRQDLAEGRPVDAYFDEIGRAVERSAALTRQLLAYARRQPIKPQTVNLNALVREMEKLLRRTLMEDILLRIQPSAELWNVEVDPGQFEQVLLNLAINARDAMPDGGVLTIETGNVILEEPSLARPDLSLGAYVLVRVADSGRGMDPEVREHAFEPFFSTKETGKGIGLGLASAQGIVSQSGGKIFVESEPGRGTTFYIYLPRSATPASASAVRAEAAADGEGGRVLLVEDHDTLRELFVRGLEQRGFTVVAAASASDALRRLEALDYAVDVLVTDVIMPVMGGHEFAARVRQWCPGLPVIFMSGYSEQRPSGPDAETGPTRFLAKPFTPTRLANEVRAILDATALRHPDRGSAPVLH